MAVVNQNFSMYSGETKYLVIDVTDDNGNPFDLTGSTFTWALRQRMSSPNNLVTISDPNRMTIDGNTLTILLYAGDTENLKGKYYHECKMTDGLGDVSIILSGEALILYSNL